MPREQIWEAPLIRAYQTLLPTRTQSGGFLVSEILAAHRLWPEYDQDFFVAAMQRMNAAFASSADG